MAPQGLQNQKSTASNSSREGTLLAAIKNLVAEISKEKKIAGHITASKSLNPLRESIRAYRKVDQEIPEDVIDTLVASINNQGNNLCHRLEPAIFSALIEAMLQAQPCRQAERGLYLLADSLFKDHGRFGNERNFMKRKDQIGKESLQPLLNYFLDAANDNAMRRRVGILCGQVCNECQPNLARLELGPDVTRQRIGPALIDESDELVRVICGHLIRGLIISGCKLAGLFPPDADKRLYESFPSSTQGSGGWTALFDSYIDYATSLIEQLSPPDPVFYGTNFRLQPNLSFGTPDKTVYMLVGQEELTILAPTSSKNMDKLLEIPLQIICQMTIILGANSQNEIVEVIIQLVKDNACPCYLDTAPVVVEVLHAIAQVENAREFGNRLKDVCPTIMVIEQQKDDLEDRDGNESRAGQQNDEITIERDDASSQLPEIDSVDESRQSKLFGSQQQNSILVDRENFGSDVLEEPDAAEIDQPLGFASQQQQAIMVNRESAESFQESEEGDIHSLASTREREPHEEVSPAAQLGQSQIPPSKIKPPAKKQIIKPRAKPPLNISVIKSQAHITTNKPKSPVKGKGMDQERLQKSLPNVKSGLIAASTLVPHTIRVQGQPKKTPAKRDEIPVHDENDDITSPNNTSILDKVRPPNGSNQATTKTSAFSKKTSQTGAKNVNVTSTSSKNRKRLTDIPILHEADPFVIPADEDDDDNNNATESKIKRNPASKLKPKNRKSLGAITKSTIPAAAGVKKKRQSAPAKILSTAATRHSLRRAPVKAAQTIDPPTDHVEVDETPVAPSPTETSVPNRKDQRGDTIENAFQLSNPDAVGRKENRGTPKAKVSQEKLDLKGATKTSTRTKPRYGLQGLKKHEQEKQSESSKKATEAKKIESRSIPEKSETKDQNVRGSMAKGLTQVKAQKKAGPPKNGAKKKNLPKSEERVYDSETSEIPEKISDAKTPISIPVEVLPVGKNSGEPTTEDHESISNDLEAEQMEGMVTGGYNVSIAPTETLPVCATIFESKPDTETNTTYIFEPKSTDAQQIESTIDGNDVGMESIATMALALVTEELLHHPQSNYMEVAQPNQPPTTPGNVMIVKKALKTFPKSKDSVFDWAESLGSLIDSDSVNNAKSDGTQGKEIIHATNGRNVVARELGHSVQLMQPTAQTPTTERDNVLQNVSFDLEKKRKSAGDGDQFSSKWRITEATQKPATGDINPPLLSTDRQKSRHGNLLVDDYLMRKPQIINFASDGPKNQGLRVPNSLDQHELVAENDCENLVEQPDLKRKRSIFSSASGRDMNGPLKKRQGISPPDANCKSPTSDTLRSQASNSSESFPNSGGECVDIGIDISTSPVPMAVATARLKAKRLSSQSSRVDYNGSPLAPTIIDIEDNLGKLEQEFAGEIEMNDSGDANGEDFAKSRANHLSSMFEPRIILGNQTKARPSSPSESGDRYIAHAKTDKGHYQGIRTREIIEENVELADPFSAEKLNHNNSFVQRLKDKDDRTHPRYKTQLTRGARLLDMWNKMPIDSVDPKPTKHVKVLFRDEEKEAVGSEGIPRRTRYNEFKSRTLQGVVVPNEKTKGQKYREMSTPSDVTSGSSMNSSQLSRKLLEDTIDDNHQWNLSIRPYYTQAADALHRAVDETIVQLSNKEDRMEYLVADYEGKGNKVLCNFEVEHNKQLSDIQKVLQQKSDEVLNSYKHAYEFVGKNAQDSDEDHGGYIARFEMEWGKRQGQIQDKILKGMEKS